MKKSIGLLSNNQLKIIAIIAMTCDHIGKQILPDMAFLQIIGRIAFPIFAYMIAEGCFYTRNRKKHLLMLISVAIGCQLVYFVFMRSLYQCILVTFSLSVMLIYIVDNAMKKRTFKSFAVVFIAFAVVYLLTEILPNVLIYTDFAIDYGLVGVLLPVFVYTAEKKRDKLVVSALMLIGLAMIIGGIQWYSLLALPLLALYNGEKGKARIKNFFYIYYPLHLAVIYWISTVV
ncbi:MAG: hypothetical protein IJX57_05255 [Clostridia bacterium]|nr:hypothetical protein [Clostridia bacterium]